MDLLCKFIKLFGDIQDVQEFLYVRCYFITTRWAVKKICLLGPEPQGVVGPSRGQCSPGESAPPGGPYPPGGCHPSVQFFRFKI